MNGGRFDFDDGGTYCGGWEEGKAHGHGVCTGPKGQGEYAGAWHFGFEVSGLYTWPSGNTYEGQWQNGKRHGLGIERRGRWLYRGEWTQGYKGRYGVRQSANSQAKFEGTWSSGLQDGYGTETYADGGTYQGQWLRGMRHGYGVRKSAPYGVAAKYRSRSHAHASLTSLRSDNEDQPPTSASAPPPHNDKRGYAEEGRGGFVLRARSEPPVRRRSLSERSLAVKRSILHGLRITKQRSTGDIHQRVTAAGTGSLRSSGSTTSCASDESAFGQEGGEHMSLAQEEFVDPQTTETYMGEWKNDKRSGFGISERSDGLRYEGEWFNNKKFGYGATTMKDGAKEEGKYKNNILVTSQRKKHLLFVRSSKLRERIDAAVNGANRAAQIALQKADIGISRTATARDRAEQGDFSAMQAKEDSDVARICAKQFDPTFRQPGTEFYKRRHEEGNHVGYASMESEELPLETAEARNPHHRSQSLFIPQHHRLPTPEDPDMLTPPMETPPSDINPATPTPSPFPHQLPEKQIPQQASSASVVASASQEFLPAPSPSPDQEEAHERVEASQSNALDFSPTSSLHHVYMPNHPELAAGSSVPIDVSAAPARPSTLRHPDSGSHRVKFNQIDASAPPPPHSSGPPRRRTRSPKPHFNPLGGGFLEDDAAAKEEVASSRFSLNQIMNDHFDQYTMAANPNAAKLYKANLLRTQPASSDDHPPSAPPPLDSRDTASDVVPSAAHPVTRRSTLSSTRDWQLPLKAAASPPGPATAEEGVPVQRKKKPDSLDLEEPHGSLPDLADLEKTPVHMSREDASRLSSQRRQELVRLHEEEELLRGNPLRYLFHPTVRAWFARWKLPLLVLLVNVCLSVLFYQLLTYQNSEEEEQGGGGGGGGNAAAGGRKPKR